MNEEKVQEKKPDEIYCPSCAKPIKRDAVVCPNCGVQIKELKVSAEVKAMTPEQELEEGRRQLGGIKVYYWFVIVVLALYLVVFIPIIAFSPYTVGGAYTTLLSTVQSVLIMTLVFGIWMAVYIIPLVGIIQRKPFSVIYTRVILILTMFSFPIGTIIGAVLWQRINNPLAKKYLNFGA
jgi:predicted RNA-binding Zn-ribbon protein involved in translation (DUF1610 family)